MAAASDKGRCCQYPNCGYNPELNKACTMVRQAYGACPGPCDGPCYVIAKMKHHGRTGSFVQVDK